jgi:hypothetical protein
MPVAVGRCFSGIPVEAGLTKALRLSVEILFFKAYSSHTL